MGFGANIVAIRKAAGMTRNELAEKLDIPYTTLRNYETDQREPGHKLLIKLSKLFSVTVDELVGNEQNHKKNAPLYSSEALALADDYDKRLDTWGRKQVRAVADNELSRLRESQSLHNSKTVPEIIQFSVTEYEDPMSAGTGQPAGYGYGKNLLLTKEPPPGTSYVAPIAGDSMEPTYHNGDRLFIQACYSINVGEVGVFFMDDQQWVKELGDGVLLSHNPEYEPRPMTEDIRCQGRVLGVCDESYLQQ